MGFRDWESPEVKQWDNNDDYYTRDTRRMDALEARRFNPASLEPELDGRYGSRRRWMYVNDAKYLKEEFIILNTFDGLVD